MTHEATDSNDTAMTLHHDLQLIDEWLTHLARHRSANTVHAYGVAVRRAAHQLPNGLAASTEELETWVAKHKAPRTRSQYRSALISFYRWCWRQGLSTGDPTVDMEPINVPRGIPRPCTDDDLKRILTGARDPVRLWSLIACYAGARVIELCRLRREDVTEQTVELYGKGDRRRLVPTHPAIWTEVSPLPPGLIAGGSGEDSVGGRMRREYRRLGLAVTPHQLRHWAGTRWQRATGDIRVTQELLGHSSPAVTQVYTAVSNEAMRAAVRALPGLSAGT